MLAKPDQRNIGYSSAVPQPATLQVEQQLDCAAFSLEALESTLTNLINRLAPVSEQYDEDACGPDGTSDLVPVAARIYYLDRRVRNVEARLSRALGALQI